MKQLINPAILDSIYAFFITSEEEAIKFLTEAFAKVYEDRPVVKGFIDENSEFAGQGAEGSMIYITRAEVEEDTAGSGGLWGARKPGYQEPKLSNFEEQTNIDEKIRLDYYVDECLLSIQAFDDETSEPINDNIMLIKYLTDMCVTR